MAICTMRYRVYGADGHRQRESFSPSVDYDFSEDGKTRRISVINADKSGSHDYTDVIITRDSKEECDLEMRGQLSDGIFENSRIGRVELVEVN